jgi:outer membrane protein
MDLFMTFVKQQVVKAVLGVALVCAFALPAAAQEMKIGVVSLPALIERAPQTKAAMDALQEEFAPRQREFQAKQKEYEDQATKAQKDLAVMGETERRNMEKELISVKTRNMVSCSVRCSRKYRNLPRRKTTT